MPSKKLNKSRSKLVAAMQHDKKKAKGVVKFALPVKLGEVKAGVVIENFEEMLEDILILVISSARG